MIGRSNPSVTTRKEPVQTRSNALVTAILDAAVQVLMREGAQRFTTARVAERAGVSVGSLYQYFPNKAAILFRLQSDEWRRTTEMLQAILSDETDPPLRRLRKLVHAFLRSECEEAAIRLALSDAAPLYRSAPEATEIRSNGERLFGDFICQTLPRADAATQVLAADLIRRTLSGVGSNFSAAAREDEEILAYADALADMLCTYVRSLSGGGPRERET